MAWIQSTMQNGLERGFGRSKLLSGQTDNFKFKQVPISKFARWWTNVVLTHRFLDDQAGGFAFAEKSAADLRLLPREMIRPCWRQHSRLVLPESWKNESGFQSTTFQVLPDCSAAVGAMRAQKSRVFCGCGPLLEGRGGVFDLGMETWRFLWIDCDVLLVHFLIIQKNTFCHSQQTKTDQWTISSTNNLSAANSLSATLPPDKILVRGQIIC